MSLILICPLCACLIWFVIVSIATHLRFIKFEDQDDNIPFNIGCHIFSFAFFFYAFLLNERIYSALRGEYFEILVYWDLGAAALLLLTARVFPGIGGSSGGFISFSLRDFVFFPSIIVHFWLLKAGMIQKRN